MPRKEIVCQFGVQDLADVCGCSKSAVFHHIRKGNLDMNDLVSVVKFIASKGSDDIRWEIGQAYGRIGAYGPPVKSSSKKGEIQKKTAATSKKQGTVKRIARLQG